LLSDPGRAALGGENREVTALFADLEGFTPFTESRPPHETVLALNRYFSAVVPVIFANGGTIIQFAGDAIVAVWNAPLEQPRHAPRRREGLGEGEVRRGRSVRPRASRGSIRPRRTTSTTPTRKKGRTGVRRRPDGTQLDGDEKRSAQPRPSRLSRTSLLTASDRLSPVLPLRAQCPSVGRF